MVYSQAVLILARQYRIPARVIQDMTQAGIISTPTNGSQEPEDGIRFKDACDKYHIADGTLSAWIRRGHVTILARPSWKFVIVSETQVRKRVALMPKTHV